MHFIIVLTSLITTHEAQSPIGGGSRTPTVKRSISIDFCCTIFLTQISTADLLSIAELFLHVKFPTHDKLLHLAASNIIVSRA